MMPVIRISNETWERLKKWAVPLEDAPDDVVKRLLDIGENKGGPKSPTSPPMTRVQTKVTRVNLRAVWGRKLAQEEYELPILEVLYEKGGTAPAREVLEDVERKLRARLTPYDYEDLPTGGDVRWRNTAQWARNELVHTKGLLRKHSRRGVWELSEDGVKFAEEKLKRK